METRTIFRIRAIGSGGTAGYDPLAAKLMTPGMYVEEMKNRLTSTKQIRVN